MKKSIFILMLAFCMALTACGGKETPKEEEKVPENSQTETSETEENGEDEKKPEENAEEEKTPAIFVEETEPDSRQYKSNKEEVYFEATLSYPHMGGTDARKDFINEYFEEEKLDKFEEIEDELVPYAETAPSPAGVPLSFETSFETVRMDEKFISFEVSEYSYMGGAYPTVYIKPYNFDKNGNEVELDSLFSADDDVYEAKVFGIAAKELEKQGIMGFASALTAQELEDSFEDDFLIDEDGITLIWQESVVAPHAAGTLKAEVSFDEISDILAEGVR